MMAADARHLEIGRFAGLVHLDGRWLAENAASSFAAEIELHPALTDALLEIASRRGAPRDRTAWIAEQVAAGATPSAAEAMVDSAEQLALLVPEEDARWSQLADRLGPAAADVCGYLALTANLEHLDYAGRSAREQDRELMAGYAAEEPPPSPTLELGESPCVVLPAPDPETPALTPLDRLGRLLFWSFGQLRAITLHERFALSLKAVASFGARHPFEAYLAISDDRGSLARGIYHYLPHRHALERCGAEPPRSTTLQLAITARPERYFWRYRNSFAYTNLFVDLGHVLEMVHVVDRLLGLGLEPAAALELPAWDGVEEFCVATFTVTTESP